MTDKAAMSDVAGICAGLTKAQREAIEGATRMNSVLYGDDVYEVRAGGATVAMHKKRLIRGRERWQPSRRARATAFYALTPLGLAVRSALMKEKAL